MAMDPLERKLAYVRNLASDSGIDMSMNKWLGLIDWIAVSIDYNCLFRFLMDMFLTLDLHFDFSQFDFWNFDFSTGFDWTMLQVPKGVYGVTDYDNAYYDPPGISSKELENLVWDWRKHTSEPDVPYLKKQDVALKSFIALTKDKLKAIGVSDDYVETMEEKLAIIEGKVFNASYVGFSFVGLSKVMPPELPFTYFDSRISQDWKTVVQLYSAAIYESHVGFCRVGYCRVSSRYLRPNPTMSDRFIQQVQEFKQRSGLIPVTFPYPSYPPFPYGYGPAYPSAYPAIETKVLYPRIFMESRVDQYHQQGGSHQIKLQLIINRCKQVLNDEGVIGCLRMTYTSYAQESAYLTYFGHTKSKQWKTILTQDDLKTKYVYLGCDPAVLDKVANVV
jgi:hypothetical protein